MSDATGNPPRRDFERAYVEGAAPWDIGRPQPEVVRAEAAGELAGTILDVGCGTGENALYLASRGHRVMGLDASATAIARARQKAAARALPVAFHEWDALQLARLRKSFDTVLDCGLFHVFPPEERRAYVQSIAEVTASGSDLVVLCFSDEEPPGWGPYRVPEHELRDATRGIFALREVRRARFANTLGDEGARAWLARFTRV